jgi:hypothetical protein
MTDIDNLRPASIDGIKRLADRLQAQHGIPRNQALDGAARRGGFNNYVHATRAITNDDRRVLSTARQRRDIARHRHEYRARTRREWSETVEAVATDPRSSVWTQPHAIIDAITPFLGEGRNHGFFPTGGGNDFTAVGPSSETGCIELSVSKLAYIVRPKRLRLERFADDLPESFLFLELGELEPSGVYEREDDDQDVESVTDLAQRRSLKRLRDSEELVDMGGGQYLEREVWDRGYLDHYDDPLPRHARRVHRLLRGNVMIACKAGIWNGISATYMGQHDELGADGVRQVLEHLIARRDDVGATDS